MCIVWIEEFQTHSRFISSEMPVNQELELIGIRRVPFEGTYRDGVQLPDHCGAMWGYPEVEARY